MSWGFTAIAFGLFTLLSPSSALIWGDLFDNAAAVILLTALTVGASICVFFFTLYLYLGYFPSASSSLGLFSLP